MKAYKVFFSVGIIIVCSVYVIPACQAGNGDENFDLHPALLYLIKYYDKTDNSFSWRELDSFQYRDYLSPLIEMDNDPQNRYYMVVKFFEHYGNLYFTLWSNPVFPDYIRTEDDGVVKVDKNNMYYFELGNINLIVLDYPESLGYMFYAKDESHLKAALRKQSEFYDNIQPILTNKEPVYETYLLVKGVLIRVQSIIPYKYETEIVLDIIEAEDLDL